MQALLGIDLGTTGVKAALFAAEDGHVISSSFVDYPLVHPHPGWAKQDPDLWWMATITAIRSCLSEAALHGVVSGDVCGVGLSGQMHGVVLLDQENNVLRPCIIWADQRSDAQCLWMTEQVGAARLIEYVSNPALPGFSAPKALWVRDNEPEVFAQTCTIILPKDYIRFRLTGVLAMEISDAAGTCLLDVKQGSWSQEVLHAIGFDPSLLPSIVAADTACGEITHEVEQLTGLLAGTLVAGGGAGGGAKSLLWRQILADVLGVQLVTTTAEEGPAFGAALLAGVASGVYASVSQACEMTVNIVDRTEPRTELEYVYARAYEKYRSFIQL